MGEFNSLLRNYVDKMEDGRSSQVITHALRKSQPSGEIEKIYALRLGYLFITEIVTWEESFQHVNMSIFILRLSY